MDTESTIKNVNPIQRPTSTITEQISKVNTASRKVAVGQNAKIVLDTLDPILEQRLGTLLDQFRNAPAELGALLDFRAKISEVWSLRQKLNSSVQEGKTAEDTLRAMMEQYAAKVKNNGSQQLGV